MSALETQLAAPELWSLAIAGGDYVFYYAARSPHALLLQWLSEWTVEEEEDIEILRVRDREETGDRTVGRTDPDDDPRPLWDAFEESADAMKPDQGATCVSWPADLL